MARLEEGWEHVRIDKMLDVGWENDKTKSMNVRWTIEGVGGRIEGDGVWYEEKILIVKTGERREYDTTPPLCFSFCATGVGSQRADKQTADDKASGRFVARGTRPF